MIYKINKMNKINIIIPILIFAFVSIFVSCETYPDFEPGFSDTYPFNGEYYVRNYDLAEDTLISNSYYNLFMYNKAVNPDKNMIWIESSAGIGGVNFKVDNKVDFEKYSFDGDLEYFVNGVLNQKLTISNSKLDLKEKNKNGPDSIYYTIRIEKFDSNTGLPFDTLNYIVKGHRKTGWEEGTGYGHDM